MMKLGGNALSKHGRAIKKKVPILNCQCERVSTTANNNWGIKCKCMDANGKPIISPDNILLNKKK